MQIFGEPPEWNDSASALLKQFLETPTGQVFLATLGAQRPAFTAELTTDSVALRAKEIQGYEACISSIFRLATRSSSSPPAEEKPAYPDVDDDNQWADVDKNKPE